MKAAVLEELNQPLVVREAKKPDPGKGEVVVKLKTAALNHRDVWIQKGLYPNIHPPVILGSDGAGVVVEVGEGVSEYWLDKEVIVNPSQGWGDNPDFYGDDYTILGLPENGTFAEYIKVDFHYLVHKPRHLSFVEAGLPAAGGADGLACPNDTRWLQAR